MITSAIMILIWIAVLYLSGRVIMDSLEKVALISGVQKFIVSFLIMATIASLPNLFVGITSAIDGVPQLSFGEIAGGNVIDLTLALALAALLSKKGISSREKTTRVTAVFAGISGVLPFILTLDGALTRADGVILIGCFIAYMIWILGKRKRFEEIYENDGARKMRRKDILKEVIKAIFGMGLLLIASAGIVNEALSLSVAAGISIGAIGILIVGLGNTLPETYMAIASVRSGKQDLVLGNLLGSVITPTLLVLGIVALISPFEIGDSSTFFITRIFLAIAVFFAVFFIWTGKKILKKEGIVLLLIYIAFLASEALRIFLV
ncbi:MAG: hypothetical protein PHG66_03265 [Candidatus Colwellbacteria bacterium]|nr:hypothetical protein [Candidatus Colwellbacteria bacterium]